MAPLVYTSDDKFGKINTLADTEVCLCKNSVTVDGHNSPSIFAINIINAFFVPSRSGSSMSSQLTINQRKELTINKIKEEIRNQIVQKWDLSLTQTYKIDL